MTNDDHDEAQRKDRPVPYGFAGHFVFQDQLGAQLARTFANFDFSPTVRIEQQWADSYVASQKRLVEAVTPGLMAVQERFAREAAESFARINKIISGFLPENLRELSREDLQRLHSVAQEQRLGVMWSIGSEVLGELMEAETPVERAAVVEARRQQIVDSCRPRIEECDVHELAHLVSLALRAVDAFDAGHTEAAQALATAVLDTAVTQYFGDDPKKRARASIGEIKKMAARSGTDEAYWRWLLALTMVGIPPAWHEYDYGSDDPLFNRNGTIHAADLTVYNPANAARALSLATTLLRWFKQEEDSFSEDEDEDEDEDVT